MEPPKIETKSVVVSGQDQSTPVAEFPKKSPLTPLLFSALGILVVSGLVYSAYWYGKREEKTPERMTTPVATPLQPQETPPRLQTSSPTINPTGISSPTPIASPTPSPLKDSELVDLNETWNKYINYRLGFSINIPKKSTFFYGACYWKEDDGDHSYRPKPSLVPVKVFEDDNTLYIDAEYFYKLGGETRENNISYFSECNKISNSTWLLRDEENIYKQGWELITRHVENDQELDQFIKDNYGPSCRLGEKSPGKQEGTFFISVDAGEFANLEEAYENGCLVNYMYSIRYNPSKDLLVTWKMGQTYTFFKDNDTIYDEAMSDSFEFLD